MVFKPFFHFNVRTDGEQMKSIHLDTSHHVKKIPCRHPVRGEILFHSNGELVF